MSSTHALQPTSLINIVFKEFQMPPSGVIYPVFRNYPAYPASLVIFFKFP